MLNSKLVRVIMIALFLAVPLSAVEFITCADGHRATRNPFNNTMSDAKICGETETVQKPSFVNPGAEFVAIYGLRPTTTSPNPNGKRRIRNIGKGRKYPTRGHYTRARAHYRSDFENFGGLVELGPNGSGTVYQGGQRFPLSDVANLQTSRREGNRISALEHDLVNKYGLGAPLYFLVNNVAIENYDGTISKRTVIKATFPDVPEADTSATQKGFNARLLFDYPHIGISHIQLRAARRCYVFFPSQVHPLTGNNLKAGEDCKSFR